MKGSHYRHQSGGSWFGGLLWMISGGAIVATLLIGLRDVQIGNLALNAFNNLVGPKVSEPQVDVKSLVLQQMREASELTTAVFTMQAVVPTEQDAALGGFVFGKTKLLYIAHGEVKAGVDLSQISAADLRVANDTIQLQLPAARILDQKIDIDKSQVYDYDRGMLGLGPDTGPQLQALAQQEALQKITAAACQEGLLQKASNRAKLVVTQLLNATGYKSVIVNTQPITTEMCAVEPSANELRQPAPEAAIQEPQSDLLPPESTLQ
jgi:hypothetical protein